MPEIKNVEIMSVGTWNGTPITEALLQECCEAFEKTKGYAKPILKLGHNDEQVLLAKDGLPAAGAVSAMYIKGKKLLADFVDVPAKIYDLIQKKAYRKVSVELYKGLTLEGQQFPAWIGAVALLGADLPAMTSLNDILQMYSLADSNSFRAADFLPFQSNADTIKAVIEFSNGDKTMQEIDNSDLQKTVEDQQKLIDQLSGQAEEFKKAAEDLATFKKESEAKIAQLLADARKNQAELFSLDLEKRGLLTPSLKKMVEPFLAHAAASPAKFSVDAKEIDQAEWLGNLLQLAKECYAINQDQLTQNAQPIETTGEAGLQKKIEEIMVAEKCSYSAAYRKAIKEQQ